MLTIFRNAQLRSRNSWVTTAACCGTLLGALSAAPPVFAEPAAEQITVVYQDLDLSLDKDVQRLYSRLRSAARSVCTPLNGRTQFERQQFRECFDASLAKAVSEVNTQQLSKLHGKSEGVRIAQRPDAS